MKDEGLCGASEEGLSDELCVGEGVGVFVSEDVEVAEGGELGLGLSGRGVTMVQEVEQARVVEELKEKSMTVRALHMAFLRMSPCLSVWVMSKS